VGPVVHAFNEVFDAGIAFGGRAPVKFEFKGFEFGAGAQVLASGGGGDGAEAPVLNTPTAGIDGTAGDGEEGCGGAAVKKGLPVGGSGWRGGGEEEEDEKWAWFRR
jgi:hypothetical protein